MMTHTKRRKLWEALVADYAQSKLPVREWCDKHGVTDNQLRYWVKWFEDKEQEETSVTWTPVLVAPLLAAGEGISVHIGAARIEVRHGFDPDLLREVLLVVAAC
jgi:transposase-like protein